MARVDADNSTAPSNPAGADATSTSATGSGRRIDQVTGALDQGTLLESLRQTHDVEVVKFDTELHRVTTLPKIKPNSTESQPAVTPADHSSSTDQTTDTGQPAAAIDWRKELEPQGTETRLSQAVRQIINDERSMPLSGIVVFTDGGQNAGVDVDAAIKTAQDAKIPVHAVGVGSPNRPTNVAIGDLIAPPRAYKGDSFPVTGYLQSQGLAGRSVEVDLEVFEAGKEKNPNATPLLQKTDRVTLRGDSETVPVKFDVPGFDAAGRRVLRLRVKPIAEDRDLGDNEREVDVDIVDRKNRVLLFAGGPSREYQFLRNMLRRSELAKSGDMVVDVLLQSAGEGVSQDANQILDHFPRTLAEISEYDTIIAFDPDWRELDPGQIDLLEKWIAEESGGLIAIAGPVFTDAWVQTPAMSTIRKLYPVEFNRRLALLDDSRYGSQQAWPLQLTREGLDAEFFWLDDTAASSKEAWDSFPGVFGFYRVRGPKLGATVYATYSDPETAIGDQKPIYFAGQFYGSGRVFYMGSGEMWRLRELDEKYFDTFYTKLIRHVSQGRLFRGSRLGKLLVESERYTVGNTVVVRAQLTDPQHQPLGAAQVMLHVIQRDGKRLGVPLVADPARKGMFVGQFTATQEGECRLELIHPDAPEEPLTRRLQVFMPKLEQQKPERNDTLLKELADGTGGQLYLGVPAALGSQSAKNRSSANWQIKHKKPTSPVRKTACGKNIGCTAAGPDRRLFVLEWTLRRLCRLA